MYVQPEIATQPGANLVTIGSVFREKGVFEECFFVIENRIDTAVLFVLSSSSSLLTDAI